MRRNIVISHNLSHVRDKRTFLPQKKDINYEDDLRHVIFEKTHSNAIAEFIHEQINLKADHRILLSVENKTYLNVDTIDNLRAFINLKLVNHVQSIRNYLLSVNTLLPDAGIFIGCVETYAERKARVKKIFKEFWLIPYIIDFICNRIFARMGVFEKLYSFFTNDRLHVISKAEMLGRLVYSGFDIIDFKEIKSRLFFVAMKTHEPHLNSEPSSSVLIKLPRVGQHGEMIGVYKFRTMHPYSEYLQNYVVKLNGYNKVGKPANDFRLASWGRVMRKLWLDEIPQLINVLLGQMKLVGVRPLSVTRFNEFPIEIQRERIKYKPGCFPPYVALCMPDDKKNIEAEVIYFHEKAQHPYVTDIKYLFKCICNILLNKIRSS